MRKEEGRQGADTAARSRRLRDRLVPFAGPGAAAAAAQDRELPLLLRNYEEMKLGWFWATDAEGHLTYLSDWACECLGLQPGEALGQEFLSLFEASEPDADRKRTLRFAFARQNKFEGLQTRAAAGGLARMHWWAISGGPRYDRAGAFTGFYGHAADVTAQRDAAEESSRLAMYDPLTSLPNRRRMTSLLDTTVAGFRIQNRACAVMLIDLDRFKQVNDTMGHPAGDMLLQLVAERIVKIVGDKEKVGRLGGDEFQVILPDVDDRKKLGEMADAIIASVSHPYSIDGSRCIIGASIGVAVFPFDGNTSDDVIRNADLALYAAKGGGRGCYRFFSSELLEAAEERRALEQHLMDALANAEMEVHYQPIVKAGNNEVAGFEALLRWKHPVRGMISPALFIPIAEEANIIAQLGEWTLRKACQDAAGWPGELRVAVNISPIQFANPALPAIVVSALANSGLPPERLELEITESVFLGEEAETDAMFRALKKLGVRLALDDFGTGYSSLGYLKSAPFDKIKIDQSFVRGATRKGSRNQAIIAAIVALAEALKMETTAEGVESFDQLEMVRRLNVSHIQGFLYSKAVDNRQLMIRAQDGSWTIKPQGPAHHRHDRHATFRKVGAIHHNHYYSVILRNLSVSGALVEGMLDVPLGTQFVIDLGDGQLVVATVRRSNMAQQGVEFEEELVPDGSGGLCTRHRISPYVLAAAGITQEAMKPGNEVLICAEEGQLSLPAFHTVESRKQTETKAA